MIKPEFFKAFKHRISCLYKIARLENPQRDLIFAIEAGVNCSCGAAPDNSPR